MLLNPYISFPAAAGGIDFGAHQYWRLRMSKNQSGSNAIALTEVDYQDAGGASIDVSGATWTAKSTFGGIPGTYDPSKAGDGNTSTFWSSQDDANEWIMVDMGSGNTMNPKKLAVTSRPDGQHNTQWPQFFDVEYSDDGSTFTHAFLIIPAASPSAGNTQTFDFPSAAITDAQYWCVLSRANNGDSGQTAISEIEFLISDADQTGSGTASANNASGGAASNAYDDNTGTEWGAASVDSCFNAYDFGSGVTKAIDQISLTAPSNTQKAPTEGVFLTSDDGLVYYQVGTFSGLSWSAAEEKTFTL